jgi:exonuclease SbcC
MIPCNLQIKNFLSYGETQSIDFRPYKLICLSGKNGHGKSALLDAITWALWGQARKITGSSKADHGLLRLGQTTMMVIFDFELNNQMYRIRREYTHSYGKPLATLEFGTLNTDGSFMPLTEKTIRGTQAKIEETLHLDFASFTNSAFLRQGQANEFSTKTPKERKDIIATILGLDQYETIRKLAMEKVRQANGAKTTLHALQETIRQELNYVESITKEIMVVDKQMQELQNQETTYKKEQAILDNERKKIAEQKKQYDMLQFKIQQLDIEIAKNNKSLLEIRSAWHTIHHKTLHGINHQALELRKKELTNQIDAHQKSLQRALELKEQLLKVQITIQQIKQVHTEQHSVLVHKKQVELERTHIEHTNCIQVITQTEQDIQKYATEKIQLEQEHKKLSDEQQEYKIALINAQKDADLFMRRREFYQKFLAQGNWLDSQLRALTQKKQLAHDEQDPSCPLCEQNLSASRRRFLKNKFDEQESFLRHQLTRMQKAIKKLKAILIEQHTEIEATKKVQETYTQHTVKIDELQKNIIKVQTTQKELTQALVKQKIQETTLTKNILTLKSSIEQLQKDQVTNLENNESYKNALLELNTIEIELTKHLYNAKAHQQAAGELKQTEQQLHEHQQLKVAYAQQEQRKETILQLCVILKELKQEHIQLYKKAESYKTVLDQEAMLAVKERELVKKIHELNTHKELVWQHKGSLENQQKKLALHKTELIKNQKETIQLQQTIDDYQTIATATSKDGIQALLIEDAIPEIEQEANDLLSKLSNNQAQVFIESLRDLKKGGTKETLDIKISDAAGIRPYEMFSGGEAFRIDFALRIAISKLLARRAGTALQTLIIDEGFGSQDEEGLGNIMDALYKIQDDFHKIIIVSHLPAMKDQFPVHFLIDKRPNGSHLTVIEQG